MCLLGINWHMTLNIKKQKKHRPRRNPIWHKNLNQHDLCHTMSGGGRFVCRITFTFKFRNTQILPFFLTYLNVFALTHFLSRWATHWKHGFEWRQRYLCICPFGVYEGQVCLASQENWSSWKRNKTLALSLSRLYQKGALSLKPGLTRTFEWTIYRRRMHWSICIYNKRLFNVWCIGENCVSVQLILAHLSRRRKWAIVIAHRPSSVRPSVVVVVRKLSHFQLLLQNRLMDFDETWYAWSTHGPLQVLLFFGQIRPGADPGRGKNRLRGVPFFKKLLQTRRLQRQTECIAMT